MKNIIAIILVFSTISCNKEKKVESNNFSQKESDTISVYYQNGSIKEKGVIKNDLKIGWWSYYDSQGVLKQKEEYKIIYKEPFTNQTIYYDSLGKIDYSKSWFFKVKLPDTIKLGKNRGEIRYYSTKKADDKYLSVIVDNEYSEGVIKRDTFLKEPNYTWFGVFAHKVGKKKVKIRIVEELLVSIDSANLRHTFHSKYFEKKVYVKDTIQ
jgi:hypothetical protein